MYFGMWLCERRVNSSVRLSVCALCIYSTGYCSIDAFLFNRVLIGWWSGVVVGAFASISEVNLRPASLVLRWATVSVSNSRWRTLISECNHSSGVGKWVPALAGKAQAGMVHSVSGWMRGVQVKLWDPLRTHAIPECLRGATVFTTRRYRNPLLRNLLETQKLLSVRLW